jgi:hypothetical protein
MHFHQAVADPVVGVNEALAVRLDLASQVRDVRAQRLAGVHGTRRIGFSWGWLC